MPLARRQRNLTADASPALYAGRKLSEVAQALLWTWLQEEPACPSRALLAKAAQRQRPMAVSLRQINRWRVTWGLNRGKGRPRHRAGHRPVADGAELVRVTPQVLCVGVQLCAQWLDHREAFGPVVAQLPQAIAAYKQTHPDEDFALLHHRASTLVRRFEALVCAPLVGIDRLTECDTHEHPLQRLLGRSYQSSTLRPFLGHWSAWVPTRLCDLRW